jgi:homoserine dehydrogenase
MPNGENTCGVAIAGCGTVGGAAARILTRDEAFLRRRCGVRLELRHIVDVDFARAREMGLPRRLFQRDMGKALADPKVHVLAELIGGTTIARKTIEAGIAAGKHVVTANKALLATAGPNLYARARKAGVAIAFEASCAGGIPIIRALYDGLIANRIEAIYGIVNGTCNHILTAMTRHGQSYEQALKEAQAAGLAEADPTLDVSGMDSAHKLAILSALAFGRRVDLRGVHVEGIDRLDPRDIALGAEMGYVVKLLAIAHRQPPAGSSARSGKAGEGICLRVRPAFISRNHPLAWVSGSFNAVSVYGHATGHTMYYGRGAGGMPTASAVVADMVSLATGRAQSAFDVLGVWPDRAAPARLLPVGSLRGRHYIRVTTRDGDAVLARLAAIFGRRQVGIASMVRHEAPGGVAGERPDPARLDGGRPGDGRPDRMRFERGRLDLARFEGGRLADFSQPQGPAGERPAAERQSVVITTAPSLEGNVRRTLAEIDALPAVQPPSVCITIVDEHAERIT